MRTAIILIAATAVAVLAALLYHLKTVDRLTDQLQAEIGRRTVIEGKLAACQSASRAECAVARAQEGKADAREALSAAITQRKKNGTQ